MSETVKVMRRFLGMILVAFACHLECRRQDITLAEAEGGTGKG